VAIEGPAVRSANAALRTELSAYDALGLTELIRTKQITALEAVDDVIRKIEAVNPKLNAVIYKTYDRARQRLNEGVGTGPFAGVPILVKDNATIAGVPLTRGSRSFRDNVPDRTASFFEAIERAGFVLVGVTNMPELGIIDGTENVLYGPTRNPWNLQYSPGGSTGGSAAAVAAGVLPLAHGTDGGGSIRIPASHYALFGLKASRGRLLPGGVRLHLGLVWWRAVSAVPFAIPRCISASRRTRTRPCPNWGLCQGKLRGDSRLRSVSSGPAGRCPIRKSGPQSPTQPACAANWDTPYPSRNCPSISRASMQRPSRSHQSE
jgi:hypothetical protein